MKTFMIQTDSDHVFALGRRLKNGEIVRGEKWARLVRAGLAVEVFAAVATPRPETTIEQEVVVTPLVEEPALLEVVQEGPSDPEPTGLPIGFKELSKALDAVAEGAEEEPKSRRRRRKS